eukprot:s1274_g2.t1
MWAAFCSWWQKPFRVEKTERSTQTPSMAVKTSNDKFVQEYVERAQELQTLLHEEYRKVRQCEEALIEDLREDGVLDSISAVLDLGHVPELCSPDEIANMLREALDFKDLAVHIAWPRFLDRVHQHLHLVLCLSPMDGGFRILRKFPKLICCCSVSHVEAWKVDSWQAMAEQRLNETDCQGAIQAAKSRLARCLAQSQELFAASATVRSFSQVLQNFTQLWRLKSAQVAKRRGRLERALQAVARAPGVLEELQRKVQGLQAEVEEQEAKLRELRDVAACIAADVQRAQEQLREAEVFAEAKESACKSLQAEVQGAMDEVVQPYRTAVKAFEKADKKLSSIGVLVCFGRASITLRQPVARPKEVSELKNFAAPPPLILAIMEMVAMLFGCSVEWSAAKNLISESNFGKRFRDFDKDGLRARLGPGLCESHRALGSVAPYFVKRYGFSPTCLVVAWSGDNPCSLAGLGLQAPGDVAVSMGTSDTMFAMMASASPGEDGMVLRNPVDPNSYMGMLVFKNGSLAREQVLKTVCGGQWETWAKMLAETQPGNGGSIGFYFHSPEITPTTGDQSGVFRFDDEEKEVGSFAPSTEVRAVVEGKFLAMRAFAQGIGMDPTEVKRIIATGGASSNKVLADVFGVPVFTLDQSDSASLGAALRAGHGLRCLSSEGGFLSFAKFLAGGSIDYKLAAQPATGAKEVYTKLLPRFLKLQEKVLSSLGHGSAKRQRT